jgi:2-polyprenyl-3-methyl-5-hydroxy-6-metoxy-1,4-benzoquinol methylase
MTTLGPHEHEHEHEHASSEKLPHEREHLDALQRMQMLRSYYGWVLDLVRPYVGRRILDAGCGVGNFTALLEPLADYVLAVDLSRENLKVLTSRFAASSVVEVAAHDLDADFDLVQRKDIDTIVCLDVLEHVEEDIHLLERFLAITRPGGHLLLKVPACPWLYGSVDKASGHYRRYTPALLREVAQAAGWQPIASRYMNLAGVLPYWVKCRLGKRDSTFSRTFKPWQLKAINGVIPMLKLLDRVSGPPVGLSALIVARKPN